MIAPAAIAVVDGRIAAVGPPDDVARGARRPRAGRRRVAAVAIPGLVDCHTHPAFGGDRADEFDLRAQGADYERIHAVGRRHPRHRRGHARPGRGRRGRRGSRAPRLDGAPTAPRRPRASRATASTATPSLRAFAAVAGPHPIADGADLSRSALGAARVRRRPTSTSTSPSPRCCPRRRGWPRPPTSSSSAAPSRPSRPTGTCARRWSTASSLRLHGDQFTESGAIPLGDRARRAVGRPPRGDRARPASRRSPRATSRRCCSRSRRSTCAARMPPARALIDARGDRGARDRLQPRERVLRLAAGRDDARLHRSSGWPPGEALARRTVNAAWVLGRADRIGPARARLRRRHRAPRRARLAPCRLPPGRPRHRRGLHARPAPVSGPAVRGRPVN